MKKFVETWLSELPKLLTSELGRESAIAPMTGLPPTGGLLTAEIWHGDGHRLTVAVDRNALRGLLVTALVTPPEPDDARDAELWLGMLRQAATLAARELRSEEAIRVEGRASPNASMEWYSLSAGEDRIPLGLRSEAAVQKRKEEKPDPGLDAKTASGGGPAGGSSKPPVSGPDTRSVPNRPAPAINSRGLDLLLDIELEASLRFGSREMPLNEVLELGAGDVVELERHISDPVDLLVGDKIVARGEVVLVNGCFGLRVTEVAEPKLRLESIRCLF